MTSQSGYIVFYLLLSNEKIRDYLRDLLQRSRYHPKLMASLDELINGLKRGDEAIVFLDNEAVGIYGVSIYSKIKAAVPRKKIILLCDQAHRSLIKEAMQYGIYGCILEPYAEWEVLTMVRHVLSDMQPRKKKSRKSKKKS